MLMKFVIGNITILGEVGVNKEGSRVWGKIQINVNQFCGTDKQVLAPFEWIHKFTTKTKMDAVVETISH